MAKKEVVKELDPQEYFDYLKEKKNTVTDRDLEYLYKGALAQVEKYKITGQRKVIRKLKFITDCVEKERELVKAGINSFVYRDDIEYYIDNISKDTVKIIELENYPREIPDEIVEIIEKVKSLFTQLYVVFTDYTGKVEREVEEERRRKDPILFGTFQKKLNPGTRDESILINDRFYYLGDWEDEYCDLTMDKFLNEVGRNKLHTIRTPLNEKELQEELNRLDENLNIVSEPKKEKLFDKIKTFLGRKK